MAKRGVKKAVKKSVSSPVDNVKDAVVKEPQHEKKEELCIQREVERQSAATRAICDMEIEHLLTGLRLLRSYFNEEQLQTPVLQFFKENLPNLSIVRNQKDGQYEVQWRDKNGEHQINQVDERNVHSSLLHKMSIAYPGCSIIPGMQSFGGFEFSTEAAKTCFFGATASDLHVRDFVLEEPSDSHILGLQDTIQTPGVSSQRLSVGMTPRTSRLPKPGEMLLSVHGSPLGVYKEDNMEAIHESEEG